MRDREQRLPFLFPGVGYREANATVALVMAGQSEEAA